MPGRSQHKLTLHLNHRYAQQHQRRILTTTVQAAVSCACCCSTENAVVHNAQLICAACQCIQVLMLSSPAPALWMRRRLTAAVQCHIAVLSMPMGLFMAAHCCGAPESSPRNGCCSCGCSSFICWRGACFTAIGRHQPPVPRAQLSSSDDGGGVLGCSRFSRSARSEAFTCASAL